MISHHGLRWLLRISLLSPSLVVASPLLDHQTLFASGPSPTQYTGIHAGQIQNSGLGTQTINAVQMNLYGGPMSKGSCTGTNFGNMTISTGALSFEAGYYLHINPVAAYNEAIGLHLTLADIACVQLTAFDTVTAASPLNFFNPNNGTTLYPSGTNPSFNLNCVSMSGNCVSSDPILPVAVMQGRITVGSYVDNTSGDTFPLSYSSADNGDHWALSTTLPAPAANITGSVNQLLGSACDVNGLQCVTVGNFSYPGSPGTGPLTAYSTDGGINWQAPTGAPPTLDSNNSLNGVACDSAGMVCNAVGSWFDNTTTNFAIPLSYYTTDGGSRWTQSNAIPVPQNSGAPTGNAYLYGIACNQTGQQCSAVGNYTNANNQIVPLSYLTTNGGQDWALATTLPPAQTTSQPSILTSVACDSATGLICTAVGNYFANNTNLNTPSAYTSTDGGNTWILATTQPLADSHNDNLTSVSCGSDGLFCSAVGYNDNNQALSYYSTNSGATWSKNGLTQPTGASPQLMNVFCLGAGPQCSATGFYTSAGSIIPLSYWSTDGGRNWASSTTQPATNSATNSQLYPQTGNLS